MQKNALPDDTSEEEEEDMELDRKKSHYVNFIAMTQSMKLEYDMLQEYEVLREEFTNSRVHLMQTMTNLDTDHESITYEAILLLSLFILMPNRNAIINKTLGKNGS